MHSQRIQQLRNTYLRNNSIWVLTNYLTFLNQNREASIHESTPILAPLSITGIDAPSFSLGFTQLDDEDAMEDLNHSVQVRDKLNAGFHHTRLKLAYLLVSLLNTEHDSKYVNILYLHAFLNYVHLLFHKASLSITTYLICFFPYITRRYCTWDNHHCGTSINLIFY